MAIIPRTWSRWSVKRHIFSALLGALVVIAVAAGVSVSLAPAHVFFSIANATTSRIPVESSPNLFNGFYNFTLVANNTSWRTKVRFATLSAQIWYSTTGYILAQDVVDKAAATLEWHDPRAVANVAVWAEYGQYDEKTDTADNATASKQKLDAEKATEQDCRVVVEAKVRFKYGLAATMPYTIRMSCLHVNFSSSTNVSVQCN